MMIVKEPGIAAPRPAPRPPAGGGVPAGGGPTSEVIAKRWPVLLSNAIVRAPFDGYVFKSCSSSRNNRRHYAESSIADSPAACVWPSFSATGSPSNPSFVVDFRHAPIRIE